ncbi:MAG: hypothetical protein AAF351_01595 [Pseudomonadota bacterium]
MAESDDWLARYERIHQDLRSPAVFWAAVPLVVIGTVGLLWALPVPEAFRDISPFLNWGSAFLMATAVYYFVISVSLALGMLPFLLAIAAFQVWLTYSGYLPVRVATAFLVGGILGLWVGHPRRPRLRTLAADLQLVMIGPAWALSNFYRRIGIPI